MALKYKITAEEHGGLSEGVQELYSEKDGTFVLALDGLEDVSGLKSALEKERLSVKEYKEKVRAWEALGKRPDELSEMLKKLDKPQSQPQPQPQPQQNPTEEQLGALREEIAALRKEQATRERTARISKMFGGYSDEQKADFVLLVKGETGEEIAASVAALKERYPLHTAPQFVGGPSNPGLRGVPDALRSEVKAMAKEARAQSENDAHWKGF